MKIAIANDHRGYQTKLKIKSILEKKGYEIIDIGTDSEKRVDHPVYAFKLCDYVKAHNVLGIAICGTGLGMSIDCNKVKGIRCAKIDNKIDAVEENLNNKIDAVDNNLNKKIDYVDAKQTKRSDSIMDKLDYMSNNIAQILEEQIKMRKESIKDFEKASRTDLINSYQKEIDILEKYMPESLSDEELNKIIDEVIFNYMDKKGKLKKYSDFMLEYFSNLMYDVVLEDEKLDFELVKRSFVYLNMNIFETRLILNKMRKRLKNEVKCKILEFPKNRR